MSCILFLYIVLFYFYLCSFVIQVFDFLWLRISFQSANLVGGMATTLDILYFLFLLQTRLSPFPFFCFWNGQNTVFLYARPPVEEAVVIVVLFLVIVAWILPISIMFGFLVIVFWF